ncbi:unnamed protein product [Schistosoma margrebowiei]|uniref:Uncharacterized protein n=1 Tax=Schistosoma margrebowiei TaxID=48269 RepID=A0A183LVV7_9TREM|nr:unnamed protein product [Schistosoma margrebowiei]
MKQNRIRQGASVPSRLQIAGCPAAEKILLMNREYSDNTGSLENCLDLGKTDELMDSNSTFCDEKLVILSSALAAKTTVPERLPISSSCITSSSSHLPSTAGLTTFPTVNSSTVATTTTSNCSGKLISTHLNVSSNLPKSDLRFHNRLTTSFVPLIPNRNNNNNNSTVITTVAATVTTSVTTTNTAENNHTATTTTTSICSSSVSLIINSSEDQNRSTSSTLTGTNSETSDTSTRKNIVARFVSRPSTLLPSSSSLAQSLDVIKAQRQAVSKFADGINQTIHPTSSNNLTPCYWSSDLQNLSPILTPSTWKLLKNLTSSCNNNTTNNSGINTNSIQQSFLLTPTLSPLYPVLPTQAFTSITSMESLRSVSNPTIIITSTTTSTPYSSTTLNNSNTTANVCANNDNNKDNNNGTNSTVLSVVESNPTTYVNNNLLINPTTVTTTNINNTTCSSLKTTFDNCDNNTNNNRTSESSNILSKDNDNDKSIVDESSRIILMQQSSQLNGQ